MSERLSISIPGDLHKRLSHFKDNLNMSKICQEAISHAVHLEEIRKEGEPNMEKLLARLKEEKQQYGKKYIEEGFRFGVQDAYGMNLDDFLWIHNIWDGLGDTYSEVFESYSSNNSREYLKKLEHKYDIMENDNADRNMDEVGWGLTVMLNIKHFFSEGWFSGLFSIWEQVQAELMEEKGPCDLYKNKENS